MRPPLTRSRCCGVAACLLQAAALAAPDPDADSLADLSLEELSRITITSVSKRPERLTDAPTSVFVITRDDIRRSGVNSLPEALRLAPNLQVARVSANGWAISARGFNSSAANKLLVLIDGRSVYSPLFSGVFWDVQNVLLDDVERIEVISGPGGTLWGVNAVNGVINVITRSAHRTEGQLVVADAGNQESQLAVRHGASLGDDTGHYRIYAQRSHRQRTETANGTTVNDASNTTQLGFRADWARSLDRWSLQADAYSGQREQPLPGSIAISGVNLALATIAVSGASLLARWDHPQGGDASVSAQVYLDHIERTVPPTFADRIDIVDLQLQQSTRLGPGQAVVWGAQYRYALDQVDNSSFFAFLPARFNQAWSSLFVQDEVTLAAPLRLTLGARIERNDYTGAEFLPNLRLAWTPGADQLVWASASRTVRAPSRFDRDTFVPGQPPFLLVGGPDFRSEVARVYELGYRAQLGAGANLSITAYHADYDHLHTQDLAPGGTTVLFGNGMQGSLKGIEMWGSVQMSPTWRLHGGYTRLSQDLHLLPGIIDTANSVAAAEGSNPARQWSLRSSLDLPNQTEFEFMARHVSALSAPAVPAYLAVDARLGWHLNPSNDVSISGFNLVGSPHGEFTNQTTRTAFGRTLSIRLVSRF